jgi:hypothetical protein
VWIPVVGRAGEIYARKPNGLSGAQGEERLQGLRRELNRGAKRGAVA